MGTLRPFQIEGVAHLASNHGAYLTDDRGLGKTVESITAATITRGPVLVICRSVAKPNWKKHIVAWDPGNDGIEVCYPAGVFDVDRVRKWFDYPRKRGYLIIHQEALLYIVEQLQKFGIWQCVILDEAHHFRNKNSKRTKCLFQVPSYYRWALSGTPFRKSPAEMWAVLNWLNPGFFSSYWKFRNTFTRTDYYGKFKAMQQTELFKQSVGPYVFGRTKEQVASDMPPKDIVNVPVALSPSHRALYDAVENDALVGFKEDLNLTKPLFIPNVLSRAMHLRKVALEPTYYSSEESGDTKFDWLLQFIEDLPEDEPLIVFTYFKEYANMLGDLLPGFATISGSVSENKREHILEEWDAGNLRGLIGTISTMSESLNLQRSHTVVFMDLSWSSIEVAQAEDRCHRLDITSPVQIYRLIAEDTIDEDILESVTEQLSTQEFVRRLLERRGVTVPPNMLGGPDLVTEAVSDVLKMSGML